MQPLPRVPSARPHASSDPVDTTHLARAAQLNDGAALAPSRLTPSIPSEFEDSDQAEATERELNSLLSVMQDACLSENGINEEAMFDLLGTAMRLHVSATSSRKSSREKLLAALAKQVEAQP